MVTKLQVPPVKPNLVSRARLVRRLEEGMGRKLTLLRAPAGSGKTTLLGEWVTGGERPVAWVSLHAEDNERTRFLDYLLAALRRLHPKVGKRAGELLRSAHSPPLRSVLTVLINEIAATVAEDFALVMDNYHTIENPQVHEATTFLLDHLPSRMHLVLASRTHPPLPLARLLAGGQLTELSGADLRFTLPEIWSFLEDVAELELRDEDVALLESRTEGWVTGVQLLALSARGHEDVAGRVVGFTGGQRHVWDYLAEEVFGRQDEAVRDFLIRTSILDRVSGPLCNAVTGRGDGQELLEASERDNLFLVPLDDERLWYRYQHLFSDSLRKRLSHTYGPQQISEMHRRACEWFEREGLTAEAINQALVAGESERAGEIVQRIGPTMLKRSEFAALLGWLKTLPEEVVRRRPWLSLFYARIYLATGKLDVIEPHLRRAERALDSLCVREELSTHSSTDSEPEWGLAEIPGHILAIRAVAAGLRGDASRAVQLANRANELLIEGDPFSRSLVAGSLGVASRGMGDVEAARRVFAEALEVSQEAGNTHMVLLFYKHLSELELVRGRLREAEHIHRRALREAPGHGGGHCPAAGLAYVGLGNVLRERNELEAARSHLGKGITLGKQGGNDEIVVQGIVALARVEQAQGDLGGSVETLWEAKRAAQEYGATLWVGCVEMWQARLWAARGNLRDAARWERECGLTVGDELSYFKEFGHITLAKVLSARGKHGEAIELLERLLRAAEAGERAGSVVEILALMALALRARGEIAAAVAVLRQALSLAEPAGYVRIFADEGEPMAKLLQKLLKAHKKESPTVAGEVSLEYLSRLLAAFWRGEAPASDAGEVVVVASPPMELLSEAELKVLRLVASGISNRQIAGELFVSVNTVKSHLKHVNSKLGANSRTQAIARARELNLLP